MTTSGFRYGAQELFTAISKRAAGDFKLTKDYFNFRAADTQLIQKAVQAFADRAVTDTGMALSSKPVQRFAASTLGTFIATQSFATPALADSLPTPLNTQPLRAAIEHVVQLSKSTGQHSTLSPRVWQQAPDLLSPPKAVPTASLDTVNVGSSLTAPRLTAPDAASTDTALPRFEALTPELEAGTPKLDAPAEPNVEVVPDDKELGHLRTADPDAPKPEAVAPEAQPEVAAPIPQAARPQTALEALDSFQAASDNVQQAESQFRTLVAPYLPTDGAEAQALTPDALKTLADGFHQVAEQTRLLPPAAKRLNTQLHNILPANMILTDADLDEQIFYQHVQQDLAAMKTALDKAPDLKDYSGTITPPLKQDAAAIQQNLEAVTETLDPAYVARNEGSHLAGPSGVAGEQLPDLAEGIAQQLTPNTLERAQFEASQMGQAMAQNPVYQHVKGVIASSYEQGSQAVENLKTQVGQLPDTSAGKKALETLETLETAWASVPDQLTALQAKIPTPSDRAALEKTLKTVQDQTSALKRQLSGFTTEQQAALKPKLEDLKPKLEDLKASAESLQSQLNQAVTQYKTQLVDENGAGQWVANQWDSVQQAFTSNPYKTGATAGIIGLGVLGGIAGVSSRRGRSDFASTLAAANAGQIPGETPVAAPPPTPAGADTPKPTPETGWVVPAAFAGTGGLALLWLFGNNGQNAALMQQNPQLGMQQYVQQVASQQPGFNGALGAVEAQSMLLAAAGNRNTPGIQAAIQRIQANPAAQYTQQELMQLITQAMA